MSPRKVYSGTSQYVAGSATVTLHTGPGKILSLTFTASVTTAVNLFIYDNTSAAAPAILFLAATINDPIQITWPPGLQPVFTTGLTVNIGANGHLHIITEAEA